MLKGKRILNIFTFRGHRTLKSRSKFIFKNLFLFNSKLNGRKLGFITPLKVAQRMKKQSVNYRLRYLGLVKEKLIKSCRYITLKTAYLRSLCLREKIA